MAHAAQQPKTEDLEMTWKRLKSGTIASITALALATLLPLAAEATPCTTACTLIDQNSTVTLNATSQAGMFDWFVDGRDILHQQWFWYRVGSTGPEASIDTLSLVGANTVDANFNPGDDRLNLRYLSTGLFQIDVTYDLGGGPATSRASDVRELITITNLSGRSLDFHFFQYADFDISNPNDTAILINANTVRHAGSTYVLNETVVTPAANRHEVSTFPLTLMKLNDGVPTDLSNASGPVFGDATWAFQWDTTLTASGPGSTFQISKDKNIRPVAEPSSIVLLGAALGVLALWRRGSAAR